jgi:Reverse transcriptase (RNA-dependent DNA polymerase)
MIRLQTASLDWALAHVEAHGDTDVLPLPFEYAAIRHDWTTVRAHLAECDVTEWTVRPHRALLAPKARYGFRVVTQLDPLDFLLFAATIYEVAADLEARRVPMASEVVFSYRVARGSDGQLFDPAVGFRTFLEYCRDRLTSDPSPGYVAATDISDFYPRIYHHRLENALRSATTRASHISAIMHLLSGWNGTETFGIPVGNAPSRLLAELTLSDVDEAMLANGLQFVRFNDDYRIFADSHAAGYSHLSFLAEILYRNHGLTLQQQKTTILPKDDFIERFLTTPLDREVNALHQRFDELLAELGVADAYETIDYDDLSQEQQELVDSLNLQELLHESIATEGELDVFMVKFLLRRLAQLSDYSVVDDLLDNLEHLHLVFPDLIRYFATFTAIPNELKVRIGTRLLDIYEDSIINDLDYHKLWCLDLFASSRNWSQHERFFRLYGAARDNASRRKLILAMGRAGQQHWFQSQWRSLMDFAAWPRRALLAGASCMPPDARRHWYRSVDPRLDPLERAVARWARQHPFA